MDAETNKPIIRHRRKKQPWAFKKRPDSAAIARPKKVYVVAAAESWHLLNSTLDGRTRLGKLYQRRTAALEKEIGQPPTVSQRALIEQAVRFSLLADLAWAECIKSGLITETLNESPAFAAYAKVARELRTILASLFPDDMTLPEERVRVIFKLPAALPPDVYAKVIEYEPATDH